MISFKQLLQVLVEDRVEDVLKRHTEISTNHDLTGKHNDPKDIINHFAENGDPTDNKQYLDWLIQRYKEGNIRQEDASSLKDVLNHFHRLKNKKTLPQEHRDINKISSAKELRSIVDPHVGGLESKRAIKGDVRYANIPGAKLIHDENGVTVHEVNTHDAACKLGAGTDWCTAKPTKDSRNIFHDYTGTTENEEEPEDDKKLYVVHAKDKNGKIQKYQFHGESAQYMDKNDEPVDVHELIKNNPELRNVKSFKTIHPAFADDESFKKNWKHIFHRHGDATIADPRTSKENVDEIMARPDSFYSGKSIAVKSRHISGKELDNYLNSKDLMIQGGAVMNPNISDYQLTNILKNKDISLRSLRFSALENPNIKTHHIDLALQDPSSMIRGAAAKHPNATEKQLETAIDDEHSDVVYSASRNPNLNSGQIWKLLAGKIPMGHHPNIGDDHLHHILGQKGGHTSVDKLEALGNKKIKAEHLDTALKNTKDERIIQNIIEHQKAEKRHIDHGIYSDDHSLQIAALSNPKASEEHLNHIFNKPQSSESDFLKQQALGHHKIDRKILTNVFNNPNSSDTVKRTALNHPRVDLTHINSILNNSKESEAVKLSALDHKLASTKHFHKIIMDKSESPSVRSSAFEKHYKNVNDGHIDSILNTPNAGMTEELNKLKIDAALHPRATEEHIDKVMKDDKINHTYKQKLLQSPHITSEHIEEYIKDKSPRSRYDALLTDKINSKQIGNILKDSSNSVNDNRVKTLAISHKNADLEDIKKVSENKDEDEFVRRHASSIVMRREYENASDEEKHKHIDKILAKDSDADDELQGEVVSSPHATHNHLDAVINRPYMTSATYKALDNPNITHEHLHNILNNYAGADIRHKVISHPKATKKILTDFVSGDYGASSNHPAIKKHAQERLDFGDYSND